MVSGVASFNKRWKRFNGAGERWPALLTTAVVVLALGYVLFRPVSHNLILYGVFAMMGLLAVVSVTQRRPYLAPEFVALLLLAAGLALYGTLIGLGNPGLVYTLLVYFATPILYFTLAAAATERAVFWFFRVAAGATVAVSGLIILFVAGEAGIIAQLIPVWLEETTGLGATFARDSSQARSYGLSSLAALGPLWAGSLVTPRDALLPHWLTRVVCTTFAAGAALISSREAIVLVIIAAPLLALVIRASVRNRSARPGQVRPQALALFSLIAAFGSALAIFVVPRFLGIGPVARALDAVSSFFTGRSSTSGADQSIRSDQAMQLLEAWARNPVFGAGFGARVPGYARTSERPWVLELQYHLFLFNAGLVGVLFAVTMAVCAILLLRRAARTAPDLLSTITVAGVVGTAMLIANATNPYLQAPGHAWAVFLPLAVANVFSRRDSLRGSDGKTAKKTVEGHALPST